MRTRGLGCYFTKEPTEPQGKACLGGPDAVSLPKQGLQARWPELGRDSNSQPRVQAWPQQAAWPASGAWGLEHSEPLPLPPLSLVLTPPLLLLPSEVPFFWSSKTETAEAWEEEASGGRGRGGEGKKGRGYGDKEAAAAGASQPLHGPPKNWVLPLSLACFLSPRKKGKQRPGASVSLPDGYELQ